MNIQLHHEVALDNCACVICNDSARWDVVIGTCGGSYRRCGVCGHETQLSADSESRQEKFEAEQGRFYGDRAVTPSPIAGALSAARVSSRISLLRRVLKSGRVLEVGPGQGALLRALAGYKVTAIEQSSVLAERLKDIAGVDVICDSVESCDFEGLLFDGFLSFHVIEHVPDPVLHMRKAANVVRDNAVAIVATPNAGGIEHRMLRRHSPNYSTAHLSLFTAKSLTLALEQAGWTVTQVETPVYSDAWLRAAAALVRAIKGDGGVTAERGMLERSKNRWVYPLFVIFDAVTYPLRKIQEICGAGNEVVVVARRRAGATSIGSVRTVSNAGG